MSKTPIRNVAHSVRQRLLNRAKHTGRLYSEIEQYYAIERFLYRLSQSPHGSKFVLKGALLLTAWQAERFRPTRDIDLLGRLGNSEEVITQVIQDICLQRVSDDGLSFNPDTVAALRIAEEADHEGIRVSLQGRLGAGHLHIQIDIGFAGLVVPGPIEMDYPTILDFPAPRVKTYTRESVIAEKLETVVRRGEGNSRLKDFADIWFLAQRFDFDGDVLARAVAGTFRRRRTEFQPLPFALGRTFAQNESKQRQWEAFLRRSSPEGLPFSFAEVVSGISAFVLPLLQSLAADRPFSGMWCAAGFWQKQGGQDRR